MNRTIQIMVNALEALGKAMALIGAGLIFLVMLLVVGDVIGRYFFNTPIPGTTEISEHSLLIIVFFAASYTFSIGGHVSVELLSSRFSPRTSAVTTWFILIMSMVMFGALIYGGIRFAIRLWQLQQTTIILGIPISPFVFTIPVGVFVLWLRMFVELSKTRMSNDSRAEVMSESFDIRR